jgi:hypothetical protein
VDDKGSKDTAGDGKRAGETRIAALELMTSSSVMGIVSCTRLRSFFWKISVFCALINFQFFLFNFILVFRLFCIEYRYEATASFRLQRLAWHGQVDESGNMAVADCVIYSLLHRRRIRLLRHIILAAWILRQHCGKGTVCGSTHPYERRLFGLDLG